MASPDNKLLRSFVALAQDSSFTRAAERLHMTQSALSQQIQRLESQLGFALFQRSTRSAQLTPEGAQLLPQAQRLLEENQQLADAIRRLQSGGARKLQIGAASYTTDFKLRNTVIDRFLVEHADVPLAIHSGSQNELIRAVSRLEIDLAFIVGMRVSRTEYDALAGRHLPGEGIYPNDLRQVMLGSQPVALLVPAESPLARLPVLTAAALAGQSIAMVACAEGRPLLEPIVKMFQDVGALVVFPPEAHVQVSVLRFGSIKRMPAITLGWFNEQEFAKEYNMVRKTFANHSFYTDLVVLAAPENDKPAIERMMDIAADVGAMQAAAVTEHVTVARFQRPSAPRK